MTEPYNSKDENKEKTFTTESSLLLDNKIMQLQKQMDETLEHYQELNQLILENKTSIIDTEKQITEYVQQKPFPLNKLIQNQEFSELKEKKQKLLDRAQILENQEEVLHKQINDLSAQIHEANQHPLLTVSQETGTPRVTMSSR